MKKNNKFRVSKLKDFKQKDIAGIFKSVGWTSGSLKYPDRLMSALLASDSVYSAYDGEKLVGILSAITDGYNVYMTYLAVMKDYQHKGCGTMLMKEFMGDYKDYRKQLITANAAEFYRKFGFNAGEEKDFVGMLCQIQN